MGFLAQFKLNARAFERANRERSRAQGALPPDWPQSMRLYLGAALLKAGRAAEAEAVFRRDLRWHQNNGWSLFGLATALEAQGKSTAAKSARNAWEKVWSQADVALNSPAIF